MIEFACSACGKQFSMADEFAGRKGKCKQCGAMLTVPNASTRADKIVITFPATPGLHRPASEVHPAVSSQPPTLPKARQSVRARRLEADFTQVRTMFGNSRFVYVQSMQGDPPEIYHIHYHVKGLERGAGGQPIIREHHSVEIQLTRDYPKQSPKCKMLTPIFHPNIEPAMICVGDHWTAGERLVDLIVRIGEMIAFQAYNIKSPLDGEAAMWADINRLRLPVDNRNLQPVEVT